MPGAVIDGNDVMTVYKTAMKAVKRARNGDGPTLIECLTYRWLGHVGPSNDIEKGLRSNSELARWKRKCPIKRLKNYIIEEKIATKDELEHMERKLEQKIEMAVRRGKRCGYPAEDTLLNHVFKGG